MLGRSSIPSAVAASRSAQVCIPNAEAAPTRSPARTLDSRSLGEYAFQRLKRSSPGCRAIRSRPAPTLFWLLRQGLCVPGLCLGRVTKPERRPRRWHRIALTVVLCIASGAAGVYFTLALSSADLLSWGPYARDFAKSPGAAGCAAVVAAVIAYSSIRRQVAVSSSALQHQREVASARAWWETSQWASGRAMPSGEKDHPLPDSVTISTLHSLAETATDDVQKVACAGMIEVLTPRVVSTADETQESNESPEQDETAAFNALASYVMATDGTSAASPKAEAAVYERRVLAALANLSSDVRAFREPQIGDSPVDAVVEVDNVRVAVEVSFARTPQVVRARVRSDVQRRGGRDIESTSLRVKISIPIYG